MRVKVTPVRKKPAHIFRFSEGEKIKLASSSSSSSPETSATTKKAKKIYLLPRMRTIEKEKSPRKSSTPQRIEINDESGYEADTESDEQESGFWRDYLFAMAMLRVHFNVWLLKNDRRPKLPAQRSSTIRPTLAPEKFNAAQTTTTLAPEKFNPARKRLHLLEKSIHAQD